MRNRRTTKDPISAYGAGIDDAFDKALKAFSVSGLRGAVLGSQTPWLEATLLAYGAKHVETIEYGEIASRHPKITTLRPTEAYAKFLNNTHVLYDFVASFSSVEHSGMGRYGDPMNPSADIEAVAAMSCLVKKGGRMFLGVPSGGDSVHWNAHRVYGAKRFPLLTVNWKLQAVFGVVKWGVSDWDTQPILVFENHLSAAT
ncbi:DUF268 domain-containing protein [Pycnococcus provasolii]